MIIRLEGWVYWSRVLLVDEWIEMCVYVCVHPLEVGIKALAQRILNRVFKVWTIHQGTKTRVVLGVTDPCHTKAVKTDNYIVIITCLNVIYDNQT